MKTEKELGKALKENKSYIEIEGDLSKKVLKLKATGPVAWLAVLGAIVIAEKAVELLVGTGGTTVPVSGVTAVIAGTGAATVLGLPTAVSAVSIAVAAGGVGSLSKLRKYNLEKIDDNKIILRRK